MLDPRFQVGNLPVRELRFRRHRQFIIDLPHRLDQQALFGLARDDGYAKVATLE
jgi:hypothetical protein